MYTDEQQTIINNLQKLSKDLNKNISSTDYRASNLKPSIDMLIKLFGSWNAALIAAKLPVRTKISNEYLLQTLKDYYKTYNSIPVKKAFKKSSGYPSPSTYERRFGSWNKALEAAGLETRYKTSGKRYSKEVIIASIHEFYKIQGRPPKYDDFNKNSAYPHADTVKEHFGSWSSAIEAAGFPANNNTKYNKDSIISAIQNFYIENNRIPQRRDFDGKLEYPGKTTVTKYFGSWNNAIEAAGYSPSISDLYGVATYGIDKHKYRSRAEAYFADNYLFGKYEYDIEPRYPAPYSYFYDWYIPSLDLYIELTAGLHPERIVDKIKINKLLNRKCLIVNIEDMYKKDFKI